MSPMTQVLLIRHDGAIILFDGSEPADVTSPGQITALGGPQVDGLTPHDSAAEYLELHTNLPHVSEQLVHWRRYPEEQTHMFVLHGVYAHELREHWGERVVVVRSAYDARKLNLTPALRRAIGDYYLETTRHNAH